MSLLVLILRPEPGDAATLAAATALGLEALAFPLFTLAPVGWDAPDAETVDALLLGSANALRHAGPGLARFAGMPALCVGQATARAARAAGLRVVHIGAGGLQGLLEGMGAACPARLLRLAGAERVVLTPPPGVHIATRTVYASHPQPMSATLAVLLQTHALRGFVALLHSAAAATFFRAECDRLNLSRARIHAVVIGRRVAQACAPAADWAGVYVAPTPDDEAMLALAWQLCHGFERNDGVA